MGLNRLLPAACLLVIAGAIAAPSATTPMLTEEACRKLHAHERAGNVACQPGVTSRGQRVRRVCPPRQCTPANKRRFGILLQERCAVPANPKLFKGEIPVSRVFVRSDGGVNYAGLPLATLDQQKISRICSMVWGSKG